MLTELNSSNEVDLFDVMNHRIAEKIILKDKLNSYLAPMREVIYEVEPYFFWKKYKDGETVWEIRDKSLINSDDFCVHPEGIIHATMAWFHLNGKEIENYGSWPIIRADGEVILQFQSHPRGYLASAADKVWINGKEQEVDKFYKDKVFSHPQGFVREVYHYVEPYNREFYLNDTEKIAEVDEFHGKFKRWWADKSGKMYFLEYNPDRKNPPYGIVWTLLSDGDKVIRKHKSARDYSYLPHPEGFLEIINTKIYLNGEKLLYDFKGTGVKEEDIAGYPGGVVIRYQDRPIDSSLKFVFYDGTEAQQVEKEKKQKKKKSIFHFLSKK
jgi:hypothetical protein